MDPRWAATLVIAATAGTGCGRTGSPPAVSVTDSAGVVIVTNSPGAVNAAAAWSLSGEPAVEVGGGADPAVPLHQVTAVAPLGGGGVAVATASPARALIFGADGRLRATVGREGGGPGEFQRVASVVPFRADSVAAWDPNRRRISIFTRAGAFVREVDLSDVAPIGIMAAANTRTPAAWTHLKRGLGGGFVLFSVGAFGPGEGVRRPEAPSYRLTAEGEVVAELGSFPGFQSYNSEQTGVTVYPFGADTYGAMSGDELVVGTAEEPELRYYGPDGALRRIVRWPDHDRAVEGPLVEQWDSSLAGWLEEMPTRRATMMREMFDRIPRPDRFPAYDGVIPGRAGSLWVGDYAGILTIVATPVDRRVPARRWLVFDSAGLLTATVETPAGFQPRAAAGDRVWGVHRDELDVESVRGYEIVAQ
jgi:hypothetical protein